ncbi:MAG: 2-oxoglutarate dehydrogenase complex dihydrolipoyllysine-residue succinyltransferase [Rhodospirillales bacterium]|nr:2-oxoglutarate dehydrogenase complex dihydrolipoyllysine-residue succinyltransferase [Rhodospirillales bacterium]
MTNEILVPALGESVTEATVSRWLKQPGEAVAIDEPLVELETDKVTLEVSAQVAGSLAEIAVPEGETVEVGALLGLIAKGAAGAAASAPAAPARSGPAAMPPVVPEPAAPSGKILNMVVPTLGESVAEAILSRWIKQAGDSVAADEPLVELETDKVTLEVNAPGAGILQSLAVAEGDTVQVGALLAKVASGATPAAVTPAPAPAASAPPPAASVPALNPAAVARSAAGGKITAEDLLAFLGTPETAEVMPLSPAVQRLVRENGLDPARIPASGKDGRLVKADVLAVIADPSKLIPIAPSLPPIAAPVAPAPTPRTAATPVPDARQNRVRMTKLRQTVAKRLKEAQNTAAMLTTFNEVDMGAVMALRSRYKQLFEKTHGTKLGFMSFFAKAAVSALKAVPAVNAQLDGDEIVYNRYYDIGMAVSAPAGLMVPVIRGCEAKSFAEIEASLVDLATRSREGKLALTEMQGGTFTITNGGIFGSLLSTPILNPPQSAILGLHKIQDRPMAIDGQMAIRPMMYVALSYDHRLIDGREAVTALVKIKEAIEAPEKLLLEL